MTSQTLRVRQYVLRYSVLCDGCEVLADKIMRLYIVRSAEPVANFVVWKFFVLPLQPFCHSAFVVIAFG